MKVRGRLADSLRPWLAIAVIIVSASVAAAAPPGVDEFYLVRLRSGQELYASKEFSEAADELRIAVFGFLEQPALLSEGLARLAVAQNAAGRTRDITATLDRFVSLERKFRVYAVADLEPEIREELEKVLKEKVDAKTLAAIPTLSKLAPVPAQAEMPAVPPAERKRAFEELAKEEPQNPEYPLELARIAAAENEAKTAIKWSTRVLELDPRSIDALEIRGSAHVARKDYAEARADLKGVPGERISSKPSLVADLFVCLVDAKDWPAARLQAEELSPELKTRPDVDKALKKLAGVREPATAAAAVPIAAPQAAPPKATPVAAAAVPPPPIATATAVATPPPAVNAETIAAAHRLATEGKAPEAKKQLLALLPSAPKDRDLRKALLEAACLSKDWKTAAAQVAFVEPFVDGEEASMFYAAVSLHETGVLDPAKNLMARARPKIAPSPFVDYYTKKILGS